MNRMSNTSVSLLFVIIVSLIPFAAQAKVDWEVSNAIQLNETPIDIAKTQDGNLTFLLTDQAKVLIFTADGKQVGKIPVDPSVTDIAISSKGEQVIPVTLTE